MNSSALDYSGKTQNPEASLCRPNLRSALFHLFLFALALISLTPFFWLLCATFKNSDDFFTYTFPFGPPI